MTRRGLLRLRRGGGRFGAALHHSAQPDRVRLLAGLDHAGAGRRSSCCSTPSSSAIIQVLVYAGAVMVLFLFVIMLLNLGQRRPTCERWPAWVAGAGDRWAAAGRSWPRCGGTPPERLALEYTGSAVSPIPRWCSTAGDGRRRPVAEPGCRRRDRRSRCSRPTWCPSSSPRSCCSPRSSGRWCWPSGGSDAARPALLLSAILFAIGVAGVLIRRNAIVLFMCIELMLNAVNLTLRRPGPGPRARRPGLRLLRDDGGRRGGRGRARHHPRDVPAPPVGGPQEHQPAPGLMRRSLAILTQRPQRRCRGRRLAGGRSSGCRCWASW